MRLLALRGATTCDDDSKEEIDRKTQALVNEMLERNAVLHDDLVSIIFTATDDLTAEFPATAARALGLGDVPLLCARELNIGHGMKRTIRVLMHFYGDQTRKELHHVYREGARSLRDDLPEQGLMRVAVIGTGLVGGSIGLALAGLDHQVVGYDRDADRLARAKGLGALDEVAASIEDAARGADVVFVAVPVGAIVDVVIGALDAGAGLVTDVGSVKGQVVAAVESARPETAARFLGGHPMAGSEQEGIDAARRDLFVGATWVLTPTSATDDDAHTRLRSLLRSFDAEVVAVKPEDHDVLVALVSHVPQLASSTLMNVATAHEEEHRALLRLAAGGFRDMTRIAASHPAIWLDILTSNRDAILTALDAYLEALGAARKLVASGDRAGLDALLARASAARRNLPVGAAVAGDLVELRIPIPDRPGVMGEVLTLAGRLGVNVADIEVAHSLEGGAGVLVVIVAASDAEGYEAGLHDAGYRTAAYGAVVTLPTEISTGGIRPLRGRLRLPGDKSISHRALMFAALAEGRSTISHLATGADVHATRSALEQLGVNIRTRGETVVVQSAGVDAWSEPVDVLDCENSGTAMRILAGPLAGRPFLTVLTGDASLRERPMARVVRPLRAMGADIDGRGDGSLAPLAIRGKPLHGVRHELAIASAQVKSALLLAGLQAGGMTEVVSPALSRDHTERMLRALGAPLEYDGLTARVRAGAPHAFELDVPGDPSSAAFFAVAAAITPGSDLVLEDMSANPTRLGFVDVLRRMGAEIELQMKGDAVGEPVGDLHVRASALTGTTIAGDEIPTVLDEIPALAIAAAFAEGVTDIRDAAELAVKESNRIGTLEQELTELGIGVEARADGLSIRGGRPRRGQFKSHGDHRIAMALAVAGNALDGESTVRGWRIVSSSYPEFADDLARLTDTITR